MEKSSNQQDSSKSMSDSMNPEDMSDNQAGKDSQKESEEKKRTASEAGLRHEQEPDLEKKIKK